MASDRMPLLQPSEAGAQAPLERFGRVTAELAAAVDLPAVINVVIEHAKAALDATIADLALVDGDELYTVATSGGKAAVAEEWRRYRLSDDIPTCAALRLGQVLVAGGQENLLRKYSALPSYWPAERTVIALPLIVGSQRLGVVGLVLDRLVSVQPHETAFLRLFADTCAQAILRVQAVAAASLRRDQLAFLAEAAVELGSSLDYRLTLAKVARLTAKAFGAWCVIEMLDDGKLRAIEVVHSDPARLPLVRKLHTDYPAEASRAESVIRQRKSRLVPLVDAGRLAASCIDAEHLRLVQALDVASVMIVALIARDRVLGAITIVADRSRAAFNEADLAVAEDLAGRAAVAIDNAELHSETLQVALRLQQAVLPAALPEVAGWQIAALYHPAGRTDIGGDLYDVIALADQPLVVVLGDVMGRGVAAAASMAQMRSAIRAYVAIDPQPSAVISKLDGMFETYRLQQLFTMIYAAIDPATGATEFANAGHLPPMVISAHGGVQVITYPAQPPLGVGFLGTRRTAHCQLEVGSTLLLYTDGVVERRTEDIERSLGRLSHAATQLADGVLTAGLASVIKQVQDGDRDDDMAALALRRVR